MRWTRWMSFAVTASFLVTAAVLVSCQTAPQTHEMTAEEKVARGASLVYSSGCVDCHTPGAMYGAPDTTRMLSGSEVGWGGPWGVSYARNLTPDDSTGLGTWTEDQIVTAIRTGHRPNGTVLLPPMPWPGFAHMTDEDAYAVAAYLKSLPPIDHHVPDVVPPGQAASTPVIMIPPPSQWDAPKTPAPGGAGE